MCRQDMKELRSAHNMCAVMSEPSAALNTYGTAAVAVQ